MHPAVATLFGALGQPGRALVLAGALRQPASLARAQVSTSSTALGENDTAWTTFGADAARFAGAARRLLVEGQRTNTVRNPRCEGAASGTPGTRPTFTSTFFPAALGTVTQTVTTLAPVNGIERVRLAFSGTATGAGNGTYFPDSVAVAATLNSVWSLSAFLALPVAATNVSLLRLSIEQRDGANAYLTESLSPDLLATLTPSLQRASLVTTLGNASVGMTLPKLVFTVAGAGAWSVAFDIGWPQFGQGAFASTPILPPAGVPAASTRGVDSVTGPLASLGIGDSGAGTYLWSGVIPQAAPTGTDQHILQLDDGTNTNRMRVRILAGTSNVIAGRTLGGSGLNATSAGAMTPGTPFRCGMALDGQGRLAVCLNGGTVQAVTGGPASGLTTLRLGSDAAGSLAMFGETAILRVMPFALPDAELASAVAALPA